MFRSIMIVLGQTVGNYRVTALLGEGGMGAVYLAEHPVIGRKAALKVIHPQHARNADVVARFVNEAAAINRIGHEHIVEVTDFGRTPAGDFYFIMEYLEGQALAELISREAPLDPDRALRIGAQIADALTACHAHGVVHRDLKPENVFLVAHGDDPAFVKVLDFGLAKLINADGMAAHETHAGVVMGTPYYMSPEQCQGKSALDSRTDIYALGVVLFEMLTGKLPFGGRSYAEVLMKQITMRPPAARSIVPTLPQSLDVVLQRALAKDPAERYATMAAFREALLDPANHSANHGAAPHASIHEDLSGRMRAARPMSRAEIKLHRGAASGAHSTFKAGTGEVDDVALDRMPRSRAPRTMVAVALALLGGIALAAKVTYGRVPPSPSLAAALPSAPRVVQVTFSSDPGGATVTAADGTTLGTTPLSIQVPRVDRSVEYLIQKPGFESKTMALIPNLPSSMFALLVPKDPAVEEDPPPTRRVATATHHHHVKSTDRLRDDLDDDGVLAPSFATETTP